jgi:hypothetical protein
VQEVVKEQRRSQKDGEKIVCVCVCVLQRDRDREMRVKLKKYDIKSTSLLRHNILKSVEY